MLEETQESKGKISVERRFFISSLDTDAEKLANAIRCHWHVENSLHWVLDVVYNEDRSTVRKGNAAENMAIIRHMSLNMLNNTVWQSPKVWRAKAERLTNTNFALNPI